MRYFMKEIVTVWREHKVFSYIIAALVLLSLARIPFGTFNENATIDTVSHFLLPAFGAPLLYVLLRRTQFLPELPKSTIVLLIMLLGISAETLWEIIEFAVDASLGLHWQASNADTMLDLISSVVGALGGGLLYIKTYAAWWPISNTDSFVARSSIKKTTSS